MNRKRYFILLTTVTLTLTGIIACGSGESDISSTGSIVDSDDDTVQIVLPSHVFTTDDAADAGWKKSKELSPETLPDVVSVWYGFYNQRDVEVRVYESQVMAISSGQEIADVATGRRKPAPFASGGISAT